MKQHIKTVFKRLQTILPATVISFLVVFVLPEVIYKSRIFPEHVGPNDIQSAIGDVIMLLLVLATWRITVNARADKTRNKPFINKDSGTGKKRKKVYLAEFVQTKGKVLVHVPCWDIEAEGKDLADAISVARDAINRKRSSMSDSGREIQEVSILDKEAFFAMVDVDMPD